MGFLEHIIVTLPSPGASCYQQRIYRQNLSQIFIIWDKLFGTFQRELPEAPPVYGITRPVHTWNPILINFQHLWLMMQDAWRTASWKRQTEFMVQADRLPAS